MNTNPPVSLQDHIANLLRFLRKAFPELNEKDLLFFNTEDVTKRAGLGYSINKDKLMSYEHLLSLFERLCSEGRSWVNLSGDSWYGDRFLVSVEYSDVTGSPIVNIVLSGPTHDSNKQPLKETNLHIL